MDNNKLEKMFSNFVDTDGNGSVSYAELVDWILDDPQYDGRKYASPRAAEGDDDTQLDTFTRLYLSTPMHTQESKKSSPTKSPDESQ